MGVTMAIVSQEAEDLGPRRVLSIRILVKEAEARKIRASPVQARTGRGWVS